MSDKLNPIIKFKEWFDLATEKEINDPNAMCLSTVDDKNTPHSRTVSYTHLTLPTKRIV